MSLSLRVILETCFARCTLPLSHAHNGDPRIEWCGLWGGLATQGVFISVWVC